MWSGSCSAEPTAKSLLAGPAEDLTPWWELDSRLAEHPARAAAPDNLRRRQPLRRFGSRCVARRWVLEGPAPAWFRGAQDLLQGTPLAPSDAFEVTRMLAAGDADDLEQLLRRRGAPDPAARHDAPAYAVEEDPAACLEDVSDDADVHWEPDGRLGVACEAVVGWAHPRYRLVERPSPAHGPRYVNALSLCQRRPAARAPPPTSRAAGAAAAALAAAEARAVARFRNPSTVPTRAHATSMRAARRFRGRSGGLMASYARICSSHLIIFIVVVVENCR